MMRFYNSTSSMLEIYSFIQNCLLDNYNPVLIIDIDDTCLSSQYGKKFVDKNVCKLVEYVYDISPNNLWFLTARDYEFKNKTLHQLNKSGLLHKRTYIKYNVVHSPHDERNNVTKGNTLISIIENSNYNNKNWYIIVDDDIEQVNDIYDKMFKENYNYSLYHFVN